MIFCTLDVNNMYRAIGNMAAKYPEYGPGLLNDPVSIKFEFPEQHIPAICSAPYSDCDILAIIKTYSVPVDNICIDR
jgi:hypothetical protein